MTPKYRREHDSMGELKVPVNALYQAQTQRAVNNFKISSLTMPSRFITALAHIKRAAAKVNTELGYLDAKTGSAIAKACSEIIAGEHLEHFPVDVFQTGSGTSTNMNANEVIATRATDLLGAKVHPNDQVNMGQSSNDVIPTAIHVSSAIAIEQELLPALDHLAEVIAAKIEQVGELVKTGRTHLMDAMPVTFAQSMSAWHTQIVAARAHINHSAAALLQLAQGGTAVGTGINADPHFATHFAKEMTKQTGVDFSAAENLFFHISTQDTVVAVSGQLKTAAVALMKIANDLRWMNSGPLGGLAEIELEALQPGSSIMPGKVNPVIPEATTMAAAQVIGNDTTITIAGQSGNFELNVMLPVIAYNVLQSIELLSNSSRALADKAIASFKVSEENLTRSLAKNPILVTALNPIIGYEKAAQIAKKAYAEKRAILDVAAAETDIPYEDLLQLLDPKKLTQGGIQN
ncbi:class II fumarate hydratase [Pseudoalteromonas sp. T1lg10]|uniref:class II fumarate hydratase n=1 Tax=Pseudoalteromonas sp. T1lg10 TaxID=2077093 RepID=UPI000CF5EE6F|nr:class II fumarate hydratase [Pseudoalteromonas sp. T1lg10]